MKMKKLFFYLAIAALTLSSASAHGESGSGMDLALVGHGLTVVVSFAAVFFSFSVKRKSGSKENEILRYMQMGIIALAIMVLFNFAVEMFSLIRLENAVANATLVLEILAFALFAAGFIRSGGR